MHTCGVYLGVPCKVGKEGNRRDASLPIINWCWSCLFMNKDNIFPNSRGEGGYGEVGYGLN